MLAILYYLELEHCIYIYIYIYLEVGHGKGPCDGIGGASKRMADGSVQSKSIIPNGKDFFNWGLILLPQAPLTSTTPAKMLNKL